MNAREFFEEFSSAVTEKKIWPETGEKYITIFKNSPERFGQILCNAVLPQILENRSLTLPRNPSADVVGRLPRCAEMEDMNAESLGLKLSLWDMKFAAEYEPDCALWINRLIKLVHLRCSLKVLIAFTENHSMDSDRLRFAARCMKRTAAYDPNSREEYLIILGNSSDNNSAAEFDWKPYHYCYKDRCFYPLFEEYEPIPDRASARLERFESVQKNMYSRALREIQNGRKKSHWMWYIFPQYKGLGYSNMAEYFSIESLDEARAYFEHPVLGARLREITQALLNLYKTNPEDIFGGIDSLKLRSSMTLFECAAPECRLFADVLDRYFKGKRDVKTLEMLEREKNA